MKAKSTVKETPKNIPRHKDTLMGLPIVLLNAAYEVSHGDETGVVVPDVQALEAALAVARVTLPTKLTGSEIRFLRKAIGIKAVNLAKFLDVTAETFSRWENGNGAAISTNAERVLRLRVLHSLREKAPAVPAKDDKILDMDFIAARTSLDPVTIIFERPIVLREGRLEAVWYFVGTEAIEEPRRRLRVVA